MAPQRGRTPDFLTAPIPTITLIELLLRRTSRSLSLKGNGMKRQILGAAGLLWLALATAAAAQGPDEAVMLRYRFQPGQEFRYRLTLTGDMAMAMAGMALPPGANVPSRIPMTMTS